MDSNSKDARQRLESFVRSFVRARKTKRTAGARAPHLYRTRDALKQARELELVVVARIVVDHDHGHDDVRVTL